MKQIIVIRYEYELTLITGEKGKIECEYSPEQLHIEKGIFSGTYTLVGGSKVMQEGCFDFKLQKKIEEEKEISPKEQRVAYILDLIRVSICAAFIIGASAGMIKKTESVGYAYLGIAMIVVSLILWLVGICQSIRDIKDLKQS